MPYIYDDEDNQPMTEENMPARTEYNPPRPERDCPNCRFKMPSGECTRWNCNFAPKQYVIEEGAGAGEREILPDALHERCAGCRSGTGCIDIFRRKCWLGQY